MRSLLNYLAILSVLVGLVAIPTRPALALCDDGTAGPDTIVCDTNPGDGDVVGLDDDDVITVTADVTNSPDVIGDGIVDTIVVGGNDDILLEQGQMAFGANGFTTRLTDLGGGRYEVRVYNSAGVEQFNDANADGAADGRFVFTH